MIITDAVTCWTCCFVVERDRSREFLSLDLRDVMNLNEFKWNSI